MQLVLTSRGMSTFVESLEDRRLLAAVGTITGLYFNGHAIKKSGETINLNGQDSITLTAKTKGTVTKVEFSGPHTDANKPFTTTRSVTGSRVVTATPFRNGKRGKSFTVRFNLKDSKPPKVNSLSLVDGSTDDELLTLHDGDTIDPTTLGTTDLSLLASVSHAQRVVFQLDGHSQTDRSSPFRQDDVIDDLLTPGAHTLVVTPYRLKTSGGEVGKSKTIHFTTAGGTIPTAPQIASLTLVDAATGNDIRSLSENDTISLGEFPTSGAFIRANINGTAKLVQFHLDTSQSLELDTSAPFEVGGPGSDEFAVGPHTLVIKAFSGLGNSTGGGDPFTFDYTVAVPTPV